MECRGNDDRVLMLQTCRGLSLQDARIVAIDQVREFQQLLDGDHARKHVPLERRVLVVDSD